MASLVWEKMAQVGHSVTQLGTASEDMHLPHPEVTQSPIAVASAGRHALLMVVSTVIVAVLNYALNIILGWNLSAEEYGRVGVSQTLIFICVWFVSAGFPWIITRAIAQAAGTQAHGRGASAWRTAKSAWLAGTLLSLAVAILLVLSYYLGWLPLEAAYAPLILLVAVTAGSLGIGSVPNAALQGLFRFGQISVLRIAEAGVNIVVSVALVALGWGAGGALAGFAMSAVLASLTSVWLLRDRPFWRAHGWGKLSALSVAVPMTVAVFGGVLLTNIDLLAIKFLTGPSGSDALTGAYQVAAVLARAPLFIGTALVTTFYPRISQDWAGDGSVGAPHSARELMRWILIAVLPVNVIMTVGAPAVVLFFFPEKYASSAGVLAILAVGSASIVLATALASILQAKQRALLPALVMGSAVVLEVIGLMALVPPYGLLGAAVASAAASLMACALLLLFCGHLNLRPARLGQHALSLLLLALPIGALTSFFSGSGRVVVAFWVSGAAVLYLLALFALNLISAGDLAVLGKLSEKGFAGKAAGRLLKMAHSLNKIGK